MCCSERYRTLSRHEDVTALPIADSAPHKLDGRQAASVCIEFPISEQDGLYKIRGRSSDHSMEDAVTLCAVLSRNLDIFRYRLGAPANADVLIRRFQSGAFESALIAIDGMVNMQLIDENILKPCMDLPETAGEDAQPSQRTSFLMGHTVSILTMKMKDNIDEIISDVLGGQCALVCEGCPVACVMDTRGFEKRTIAARRRSRWFSARTRASPNPSAQTSPSFGASCSARS